MLPFNLLPLFFLTRTLDNKETWKKAKEVFITTLVVEGVKSLLTLSEKEYNRWRDKKEREQKEKEEAEKKEAEKKKLEKASGEQDARPSESTD